VPYDRGWTQSLLSIRKVVGDAGEEVADILADAVVDAQAVEVKDEVPRTNDPASDRIRQEIADLQQDIAAGDSNPSAIG
jgi:hypothetical protein